MNETSDQLLATPVHDSWFSRFQVVALAAITLVGIIGKFYLPRLIPHTEWLELPLLMTIYFGLMRRRPIPRPVFRRIRRLGGRFALAGQHSDRHVRHYEDTCGLLCRFSGYAVQCREFLHPPGSLLLFLLLS